MDADDIEEVSKIDNTGGGIKSRLTLGVGRKQRKR